jgi:hypothetical protein
MMSSEPAGHDPLPSDATAAAEGWSRSFSMTRLVTLLFLFTQAVFILHTRFAGDHPRLLTPVEGGTRYDLHAVIGDHKLSEEQVQRRYGIPARDTVNLTPEAVANAVRRREAPLPAERMAVVRLRLRANGSDDAYWLWPHE